MSIENKNRFKYVFVILTYKNTTDIVELLESLKIINDYKVIVVNSFYDNDSMCKIQTIADNYMCDFINVENKGFSYGNNTGIKYANDNYSYDFLIISNPDIVISRWNEKALYENRDFAIGPIIKSRKNTNQNPYWPYKMAFLEKIIYVASKRNINFLRILAGLILKCVREIRILFSKDKQYINTFGLHGAFLIFPYNILNEIGLPFDENMFLFAEEMVVAYKLKSKNIKSKILLDIIVNHKEDGSISISNTNVINECNRSNVYYYEKYVMGVNNEDKY